MVTLVKTVCNPGREHVTLTDCISCPGPPQKEAFTATSSTTHVYDRPRTTATDPVSPYKFPRPLRPLTGQPLTSYGC